MVKKPLGNMVACALGRKTQLNPLKPLADARSLVGRTTKTEWFIIRCNVGILIQVQAGAGLLVSTHQSPGTDHDTLSASKTFHCSWDEDHHPPTSTPAKPYA